MDNKTITKMSLRLAADVIGIVQFMARENNRSLNGEINHILKCAVNEYLLIDKPLMKIKKNDN